MKIKQHIQTYFHSSYIDLAICTHPDKDHKDGFFELLNDNEIKIEEFWLTDPAMFLNEDDIKYYSTKESATKAVRKIWNKSDDDNQNLITLACRKCNRVMSAIDGLGHPSLPIYIVGPTKEYYEQTAKEMVKDYGIKTYETSEKAQFDAAFQISEEDAKSSIDSEEDPSPFNASSLIVLYQSGDGKNLLFAGDANTTSLQMMLEKYSWLRNIDLLKVPHHGSKRNLNTAIIDALAPKQSYISSSGTVKHPSRGIVYWLSKYGSVYSSHQCSGYLHCSYGSIKKRPNSVSIKPLRNKI